jgi:arabinogalactan oligomer/maltooligosaccharide transport system permease protein
MTAPATTATTRRILDRGVRARTSRSSERKLPLGRHVLLHVLLLLITFTVLFPLIWIVSMALDPRNLARPDGLNLIPPGASLDAFSKVIAQPTSNPISFLDLALNSLKIAIGSSAVAVGIGILAAYAFSRLKFRGREALMIAVLGVLMLPSVATIIPLFIFLNQFQINFGELSFNLRNSLMGVTLAVISAQLPFAIWNLKGYLDTIPKDLEEAAAVDGASQNQIFRKIVLPLAIPAIAVTGFLGFLPVRAAGVDRVLRLPALPGRRPGRGWREGLTPGEPTGCPAAAQARVRRSLSARHARIASNHGLCASKIRTTRTSATPSISDSGLPPPPRRSRNPRTAAKLSAMSQARPRRTSNPTAIDATFSARASAATGSAPGATRGSVAMARMSWIAPPTIRMAPASSTAAGRAGRIGAASSVVTGARASVTVAA